MPEKIDNGTTPRIPLYLVLSSDHLTPATGKTLAITISKNGAAFGNPSAGATNATEVASGWYYVDLSATDTGTNGPLIVLGTATACDNSTIAYTVATAATSQNLIVRSSTAQAGNANSITLDASASATSDLYKGMVIWTTGGTGVGQARIITNYNGSTKVATIDRAWATAPSSSTTFSILPTDSPSLNTNLQVTANVSQAVIRSGTAQTGSTANTIKLDTGASATNSIYVSDLVTITGGTGLGQTRTIISYNGTTKVATVDRNWVVTPDNTSTFNILASTTPSIFSDQGVAQAGGATTITLQSTASATNSLYVGSLVTILSGTGSGQTREITAYVGSTKVATVDTAWSTNPDSTSAYAVIPTSANDPSVQSVNVASVNGQPVNIDVDGNFLATLADDVEHGGTTATLVLESISVVNPSGDAIFAQSSGGDGAGAHFVGDGQSPRNAFGIGLFAEGSSDGIVGVGGTVSNWGSGTAGTGIVGYASANGGGGGEYSGKTFPGFLVRNGGAGAIPTQAALSVFAGGGGSDGAFVITNEGGGGMQVFSAGHGIDIMPTGTDVHGLQITGGDTSGDAIHLTTTNGNCISAVSQDDDAVLIQAVSGNGMLVQGSSTAAVFQSTFAGQGIFVEGTGAFPGIYVQGGGNGVQIQATGTGHTGLVIAGGDVTGDAVSLSTTSGDALKLYSPIGHALSVVTDNNDAICILANSGRGIRLGASGEGITITPGSTSNGIHVHGGSTSGSAIKLEPVSGYGLEGTLSGLTIKKNVALSNFMFFMASSTDNKSPVTGLTIIETVSLNGGAFAATVNNASEVSGGWYKINLAAADLNGDTVALEFAGTGANTTRFTFATQP